jgi:hypothetical protein
MFKFLFNVVGSHWQISRQNEDYFVLYAANDSLVTLCPYKSALNALTKTIRRPYTVGLKFVLTVRQTLCNV